MACTVQCTVIESRCSCKKGTLEEGAKGKKNGPINILAND